MASTNDTILPGDREVQKMSEYLQNKMIVSPIVYYNFLLFHVRDVRLIPPSFPFKYAKKKTVKCLLFAGKCSSIHIIHVAPLGARSEALNHNHLDVFSWCPGIPHYTKDFVKLNSNRFVLEHKANQAVGPKEGEQYVFVYYDQVRMHRSHCLKCSAFTTNLHCFCRDETTFSPRREWKISCCQLRSALDRFLGTTMSSSSRSARLMDNPST